MSFATRVLAHRRVTAALLDEVEKVLIPLDVEFFTANSMVVVEIDDQETVNSVVDALDRKYNLKIDSPSVIHRAAFALTSKKITVRRIGSVLQIYGER